MLCLILLKLEEAVKIKTDISNKKIEIYLLY